MGRPWRRRCASWAPRGGSWLPSIIPPPPAARAAIITSSSAWCLRRVRRADLRGGHPTSRAQKPLPLLGRPEHLEKGAHDQVGGRKALSRKRRGDGDDTAAGGFAGLDPGGSIL